MEVIPVPPTDMQTPVRNIRTRTFFIVDDRLDEAALRNGLDRLIRDHWRKLGARLVTRSKDGLFEYHLPQVFSENYELFKWSSEEKDRPFDTVASALKPPAQEKGIALLPAMKTIDSWFRPADWPFHRADEAPDVPMLFLHVSLFTDATVIAISCPHILTDQLGMANIARAWMGILEGNAPPPMVGDKDDVLPGQKPYAEYPKREIFRKGRMRVRRRFEYFFVVLGFIPEMVIDRVEESYTLFFPLPLVDSLRERYSKTLEEKYGASPDITNGDVLTGIITKFARLHDKKTRTMSLSQTVNLRGRIPQLSDPATRQAFVHNSLHYATARFRFGPSTPVSEIAYRNRQAIKQALDQKDIELGLTVIREMVRRGQPIHICEPFERSFNVTNWCPAWREVDFSAALEGGKKDAREGRELKLLVVGQGTELHTPSRYHSTIMCKTEEGYWCDFGAGAKTAEQIKEYLAKDPFLENL
ncbi:Chloramphenicol acetyltransferase-like domain protein [Pleurostoma richardsiae]|uniref:Chloramphenicol acetyltransferase-like domain protein n=1 Tax=Pleurostoma richardsiae TaxID=41990 RepID=A0AA38RB40_9PEZI|nr:Chloramphenicol acetyltransferase-like domain protein [Pleurostoma richardsiae]